MIPEIDQQLRILIRFPPPHHLIGISQYDEATNKTHWPLTMTGGGSDRGITDGTTPEQTLTKWVYEHQVPLGDSVAGARDSLSMHDDAS